MVCLLPTKLLPFSEIVLLAEVTVLQSHLHHLLVWRRIVLHLQHPRKMLLPRWVMFVHPPRFWDGSSLWLSVEFWKKVSCCVIWISDMCYFEVELQHILAKGPQRWWEGFCLKETDDWFVVRQGNRWFWCFPQNVRERGKCHVDCQDFFRRNRHLRLCGREVFWSKRDRRENFSLWLDLLIRIVFNHEGVTSASEVCIRHWDGLFPKNGLFQCELAIILHHFVYWIKSFFQFWADVDWDFCF